MENLRSFFWRKRRRRREGETSVFIDIHCENVASHETIDNVRLSFFLCFGAWSFRGSLRIFLFVECDVERFNIRLLIEKKKQEGLS